MNYFAFFTLFNYFAYSINYNLVLNDVLDIDNENKDKELKFRVGGILTVKRPDEGYIYLKNNLVNWPVQINNCILFRKITNTEIKKEYDNIIFEKDKQINELTSYIKTLKLDIVKLKKELANYKK